MNDATQANHITNVNHALVIFEALMASQFLQHYVLKLNLIASFCVYDNGPSRSGSVAA